MTFGGVLVSLEEAGKSIVVLQKVLTLAEKRVVDNKEFIPLIFKLMSVAYKLLDDTFKQEEMLEKAEGFGVSGRLDLQKVSKSLID